MHRQTEASHAGGVESHSRWTVTAERTMSVDADAARGTQVRKHGTLVHIYTTTNDTTNMQCFYYAVG